MSQKAESAKFLPPATSTHAASSKLGECFFQAEICCAKKTPLSVMAPDPKAPPFPHFPTPMGNPQWRREFLKSVSEFFVAGGVPSESFKVELRPLLGVKSHEEIPLLGDLESHAEAIVKRGKNGMFALTIDESAVEQRLSSEAGRKRLVYILMHETEHILAWRHMTDIKRMVMLEITQSEFNRLDGKGEVLANGTGSDLSITWPPFSDAAKQTRMKKYAKLARLAVLTIFHYREELLADSRALGKYQQRFGDPVPQGIIDFVAGYSTQNRQMMDDYLIVFKQKEPEGVAVIEAHFSLFDNFPRSPISPSVVQ